jgi:hypothetical protein
MPDNESDISIRLRIIDPKGQFLGGTVDIDFKHLTLSDHKEVKGADASRVIDVRGLRRTPQGNYQVTVTPTDIFLPTSQFATIPVSGFASVDFSIDKERRTPPSCPPPLHCPPPAVPDKFDEATLASTLSVRLAGAPANGALPSAPPGDKVIWVDAGDEVLVHLDSLQTRMLDGTLLVSVDLETDQTGRSPLIAAFALTSDPNDPAGLVATTDEYPRGHGELAARWGRTLQSSLWASLLSIAQDHAAERSAAPQTIVVRPGSLRLQAGDPTRVNPGTTVPLSSPPPLPHNVVGHADEKGEEHER